MLKWVMRILLPLVVVGLVGLNLAVLTIDKVFDGMSSVVESVARVLVNEVPTVRSGHKKRLARTVKDNQAVLHQMREKYARKVRSLEKTIFNQRFTAWKSSGDAMVYRGERVAAKKAVSDTSKRISRRLALSAARDTGSIAAEAIPVLGIGVIVAAAAWDIHDACATMGDLHQLELAFDPNAQPDEDAAEVCGLRVPSKEEVVGTIRHSPKKAWERAKELLANAPEVPSLPGWQESKEGMASWTKHVYNAVGGTLYHMLNKESD